MRQREEQALTSRLTHGGAPDPLGIVAAKESRARAPERVAQVEEDTPKAFEKRRRLLKLLVDRIIAGRDEHGVTQVRITYRFGPPDDDSGGEEKEFVTGIKNPL